MRSRLHTLIQIFLFVSFHLTAAFFAPVHHRFRLFGCRLQLFSFFRPMLIICVDANLLTFR